MLWVVSALLASMLHAWANILDNYLVNHSFQKIWTLTFYSNLTNVLFLPCILFFEWPDLPPLTLLPIMTLLACIQVFYLYPYYKALQHQDTSIVAALFDLGKVFVPILAFLIVGETLQFSQYTGFFLIVLVSALLSINTSHAIPINKSLYYMCLCSLLLTVEAVLYKYLFEQITWSTGFVWTTLISFLIVLLFLFVASCRKDIQAQFITFKQKFHLFILEELLTFSGSAAATLAISLGSVTLVTGIESLQPIFVLVYAILLHKTMPTIFKEDVNWKVLKKKFFLLFILVGGVWLAIV